MNNLKIIRKRTNLTQKDVATKLGLTTQAYANYEQNIRQPDINTLKKLASILHTTIDYICGNEIPYMVDKSKFSSEQNELIAQIEKLNNEQCQRVKDFILGLTSK